MIRQIALAAAILFGAAGARAEGVNSHVGQTNPIPGANDSKNKNPSPNVAAPADDKDPQANKVGQVDPSSKAEKSPATAGNGKPKMTRKGPKKPAMKHSKNKPQMTNKTHKKHAPRPNKPAKTGGVVTNKGGGV